MNDTTVYCKLVAIEKDILDYTTVVFKNLEPAPFGYNYIMCVIYPNWASRIPELYEIGYLEYRECKAGDTWYNPITGENVPYNYSNLQFIKFVKEKLDTSKKDIIL